MEFSILIRFDLAAEEMWMLTLGTGVAVGEAVEAVTGVRPDLMWPNDVQIGGRKLAGILAEARLEGPDVSFAVVGIGINVAQDVTDFPLELRSLATSLKIVSGSSPQRAVLLSTILERLESIFSTMRLLLSARPVLERTRNFKYPSNILDDEQKLDKIEALFLKVENS